MKYSCKCYNNEESKISLELKWPKEKFISKKDLKSCYRSGTQIYTPESIECGNPVNSPDINGVCCSGLPNSAGKCP